MTNEMPSIDTSGIEDLQKIKEEQDVYRDRIQKMQDMREKVSDQVYGKVFAEYSEKLDGLAAEAEPLKDKIRGQYRILEGIMKELAEQLESIRLEKEELELRHTLGEFEEEAFKEQSRDSEMKHTAKQAELDDAEEMKQQFLSVFESEEDLLAGDREMSTVPVAVDPAGAGKGESDALAAEDDGPDEVHAERAGDDTEDQLMPVDESLEEIADEDIVEDSLDGLGSVGAGGLDDLTEESAFENDPDFDDDLGDDLTDELDDDLDDLEGGFETAETEDVEPPPPPLPELESERNMPRDDEETLRTEEHLPAPEDLEEDDAATLLMSAPPQVSQPDQDGEADGTMIIANPKIIALNHANQGQVIVLGMGTTSIGRSPENDIHIIEDRISRKHSQITFGPGGYAIYDLNSENGTYVNGNRIREHFLSDGDIVTIGTYKFQYRDM